MLLNSVLYRSSSLADVNFTVNHRESCKPRHVVQAGQQRPFAVLDVILARAPCCCTRLVVGSGKSKCSDKFLHRVKRQWILTQSRAQHWCSVFLYW